MKELIEMQPFNRSQVDQSRLFSLDYETVSEPAVPLIHQESRFLFALDGAGKIVIQGRSMTSEGELLCPSCRGRSARSVRSRSRCSM